MFRSGLYKAHLRPPSRFGPISYYVLSNITNAPDLGFPPISKLPNRIYLSLARDVYEALSRGVLEARNVGSALARHLPPRS